MLTHIVCWKYKPETTEAEREKHRMKLKNLPNVIPGILSFNVSADVLHLERSLDTAPVATYADRTALESYDSHPAHKEVQAIGRQIVEKVVSVDFFA